MRRQYRILLGIAALFTSLCPMAAQDDVCMDTYKQIIALDNAGKWDKKTKQECESYLLVCDPNSALVKSILLKCENDNSSKSPGENKQPMPPKPKQPKDINVSSSTITFNISGGQKEVKITGDDNWQVVSKPEWATVYRDESVLNISCGRNNGTSIREEDIIIHGANGKELKILVKQDYLRGYLKVNKYVYDAEGDGGEWFINVESSAQWYVVSKPVWCNAEENEGQLKVTLDRNTSNSVRDSKIELALISNSKINEYVDVKQNVLGQYIHLDSRSVINRTGKASWTTFKIETNYIGEYRIEGLPGWCRVVDKGSDYFDIEIDSNSGGGYREAQGKVIAGTASESFVIKQEGRPIYIDLSASIISAPQEGTTTKLIKVQSNREWDIVNLPDWCREKRTEDGFIIEVKPNTTGAPRNGKFAVSASGEREYVEVNQE